jgi:hypothetical protein
MQMASDQEFNKKYEELINSYNTIWKDFLKLPVTGQSNQFIRTFEEDKKKFQDLLLLCSKFQSNILNYWTQVNQTYVKSIAELQSKKPELPDIQSEEEVKKYKNLTIDVFEKYFTQLFQSKEFSVTTSELLSNYSSFTHILGNAFDNYFKLLNLPNRDEIDMILKDMQELKREVYKLRKNLDLIMSEEKLVVK